MKSLSTLRKKQLIAVTGVILFGFLLAHLSGNFLIFKGPKAYNDYSAFLHSLGAILWVMRIGLIVAFVVHLALTAMVVVENRRAREQRYHTYQDHAKQSSFMSRLMPFTGTIILVYLGLHLWDFTFTEPIGYINGIDLGLYGLVVSTLKVPWYSAIYIVAMCAIGLHMGHAVQSVFQTFGWANQKTMSGLRVISCGVGFLIALGYSAIPIYVLSVL